MDKVLSQEEISALFSAMSSEDFRQKAISEGAWGAVERQRKTPAGLPCENDPELVMPLKIPVSGELRGSKLTVKDLLRMSVGDVICLKDRISNPMVLCVGGVPKFEGRILRRRGKKVFFISGRIAG